MLKTGFRSRRRFLETAGRVFMAVKMAGSDGQIRRKLLTIKHNSTQTAKSAMQSKFTLKTAMHRRDGEVALVNA
jgi:hypothetical protein